MTNEETIQNNRLIALSSFAGGKIIDNPTGYDIVDGEWVQIDDSNYQVQDLKYHSSFQWSMSIVVAIEKSGYNVNILRNTVTIYDEGFRGKNNGLYISKEGTRKEEAIFLTLVAFLKRIQENKSNS